MPNDHSFHPDFPDDLGESLDYFDKYSIETGNRFRIVLHNRIHLIVDNPLLFSVVYDDIRIARIPKYPFSIHYRVIGDVPKFLSLNHTSKDRKNWPNRN